MHYEMVAVRHCMLLCETDTNGRLMNSLSHLTDVEFILDEDVERSAKAGLRSALRMCQGRGITRYSWLHAMRRGWKAIFSSD